MNPGEFPLGSNRSRAAARSMLASRMRKLELREIIISFARREVPHATEWVEDAKDRTMGRVVGIPAGMTLAEGLRTLGGYAPELIAQAAELRPEPMEAGTVLTLWR